MECCWALCIGMHALWMICSSFRQCSAFLILLCCTVSQYKLLDDGSLGLSMSSEGFLACHYTPRRPAWAHCLCQPNPSYIGRDACRTVGGNNVRIKGIIVSLIEHPSYSYVAIDAVFEKTHAKRPSDRHHSMESKRRRTLSTVQLVLVHVNQVIQVHAQHRHSEWLTVADRRNRSPLAHGIGPRVNAQYPCHNHHQHSSNQAALGTTQSHAQATALHGCKTITIPSHRHEQEAGLYQLIYLHWSAIQAGTITG